MAQSYSKNRERNGATAKLRKPSLTLVVRARPGDPTKGLLNIDGKVFLCALGHGGISARKQEGDGATPLATMTVLNGWFRRRRFPVRTVLPLRPIRQDLGWCDSPRDRNYNRPVTLPYPASHERMLRDDRLYDACLVLDWNIRSRRTGRGSAIFLHLARPDLTPTEGCVAVSRRVMEQIMPRLSRRTKVKIMR